MGPVHSDEILKLRRNVQAYAARSSQLQSKFLATLDTLDESRALYSREVDEHRHTIERLSNNVARHTEVARVLELERDDMRDAVQLLVEKVERSNNNFTSWPHSRMQMSSPAVQRPSISMNTDGKSTDVDETTRYAAGIIASLHHDLDVERKAHQHTHTHLETYAASLEARVAEREAQLELCVAEHPFQRAGSPKTFSSSRREAHTSPSVPSHALHTNTSRNRALEIDVRSIARRLAHSMSNEQADAPVRSNCSSSAPRPADPTKTTGTSTSATSVPLTVASSAEVTALSNAMERLSQLIARLLDVVRPLDCGPSAWVPHTTDIGSRPADSANDVVVTSHLPDVCATVSANSADPLQVPANIPSAPLTADILSLHGSPMNGPRSAVLRRSRSSTKLSEAIDKLASAIDGVRHAREDLQRQTHEETQQRKPGEVRQEVHQLPPDTQRIALPPDFHEVEIRLKPDTSPTEYGVVRESRDVLTIGTQTPSRHVSDVCVDTSDLSTYERDLHAENERLRSRVTENELLVLENERLRRMLGVQGGVTLPPDPDVSPHSGNASHPLRHSAGDADEVVAQDLRTPNNLDSDTSFQQPQDDDETPMELSPPLFSAPLVLSSSTSSSRSRASLSPRSASPELPSRSSVSLSPTLSSRSLSRLSRIPSPARFPSRLPNSRIPSRPSSRSSSHPRPSRPVSPSAASVLLTEQGSSLGPSPGLTSQNAPPFSVPPPTYQALHVPLPPSPEETS